MAVIFLLFDQSKLLLIAKGTPRDHGTEGDDFWNNIELLYKEHTNSTGDSSDE